MAENSKKRIISNCKINLINGISARNQIKLKFGHVIVTTRHKDVPTLSYRAEYIDEDGN